MTAIGASIQAVILLLTASSLFGQSCTSIVVLYVTGLGATNPPGEDGNLATELKQPVSGVRISVDGQEAEVLYAGAAPTLVEGVMQINLRLPDDLSGNSAQI